MERETKMSLMRVEKVLIMPICELYEGMRRWEALAKSQRVARCVTHIR